MNTLVSGERLGSPSPFLFGAALGYLAGSAIRAFQADVIAGEKAWPPTDSSIIGVPKGVRRLTLSVPGLGDTRGEQHAKAIEDVFEGPSAYVQFSSRGVSVDDMTDKLLDAAPGLEILDLNGHSMGGWFAFEIVKNARKRGADIKVGRVALHCTPHDFGHVQNAVTARALLAMHRMGVHGGPKTKHSVAYIKRSLDEELWKRPYSRAVRQRVRLMAAADAMSDTSTMLYSDMLSVYASSARPCNSDCFQTLEGAFGSWTSVDYIRPDVPRRDRTVKTERSVVSYGNDCAARNIRFRDVRVPGMTHADTIMGCAALAAA